jgi:hypothetical protein
MKIHYWALLFLCIFLETTSVFSALKMPPLQLTYGRFQGGQNYFEDIIGPQNEFGILLQIAHYKNVYIQTGFKYWINRLEIADEDSELTCYKFPFKLAYHQPLTSKVSIFSGGTYFYQLLYERFEHTQSYSSFGYGYFFGLNYHVSTHWKVLFEI